MKDQLYAVVDTDKYPLVVVRFTGEASTDVNFARYLDQVRQAYDEGGRLGILFDASSATMPAYAHIRMQADWLEQHKDLMQKQCVGTAYVLPNKMVRTALQMIFALQKQPVPYALFAAEHDATKWLNEKGIGEL